MGMSQVRSDAAPETGERGANVERLRRMQQCRTVSRKDFPQTLGVSILVICCVASTATYFYYQQWWTWGILIGSAVFDCLLYLLVKDVTVCYRCDAHYRNLPPGPKSPALRANHVRALSAGTDAAETITIKGARMRGQGSAFY